jgi:non-ribosomal peptide synthetase component F
MVRLALLGTLLAADTERDDLLLLTFVSRRGPAELRTMFGPLFNPAFLRLRLAPEETFRQRLGRVRAAVAGTSAHVEIPHEELLRELRAQGSEPPGVQAVFSESLRLPPRRLANLEITTLKPHVESMPRGFSFSVDPRLEADGLSLTFDARFYDPAGAHDFVARFQRLAAAASRRPDRALGKVLAKL